MGNVERAFPEAEYVAFRAVGSSVDHARQDALDQVSFFLGAELSVTSDGREIMFQTRQEGTEVSRYEMRLQREFSMRSNVQITGLKFTEPYEDEQSQVHLVAYWNRGETESTYQAQIDRRLQRIDRYLGMINDQEALDSHRWLSAVQLRFVWTEIQELARLRTLIAPSAAPAIPDGTRQEVSAVLERNETLPVAVEVKNDERGRFRAALTEQLNQFGFVIDEEAEVTLSAVLEYEALAPVGPGEQGEAWFSCRFVDHGLTVMAFELDARSAGTSPESAKRRTLDTLEEKIEERFFDSLSTALDEYLVS